MADQLINQLDCDKCNFPLSFFPIYFQDDKNICGRCDSEENGNRNRIYETAVAFHKFPCRYKDQGCNKKNIPKDVPGHEKYCLFRLKECLFLNCIWKGALPAVINHCIDKHSELMVVESQDFNIDLTSSKEFFSFLIYEKDLLIVSWTNDQEIKRLEFSIKPYREELEEKKYRGNFTLRNGMHRCSTAFDTVNIAKLSYPDLITEDIKLSKTIGVFLIGKFIAEKANSDKAEDEANMLSLLKCTTCSDYVLPPIYTLRTGLIYCNTCCNKMTADRSSNITLNNIANMIPYPCKNKQSGCKFVGVPPQMKNHLEECQFRVIKCILNNCSKVCSWEEQCNWIESHIDESHAFEVSGKVFCFKTSENTFFTNLIKFKNTFFEIIHFLKDDDLYWFVRKINGMSGNFKYEIELNDTNDTKDSLIIRKSCANFKEDLRLYDIPKHKNVIRMPIDQITNFLSGNDRDYIYFTINIVNDF